MCMYYKDTTYDYAFELKIPVDYSSEDKTFRIVASKFREGTQDFTGLCLENELTVISDEKSPFEAFLDIVSEIVDITVSSEKCYAEEHEGRIPVPRRRVKDKDFLAKFEKRKNSRKSFGYYKDLKMYFEKPERLMKKISDKEKPDLWEYLTKVMFLYLIRVRMPQVKNVKFFKL